MAASGLVLTTSLLLVAGQHPHPGPQPGDHDAPIFRINLDLPAGQRWDEVGAHYKGQMKAPMEYLVNKLGKGSLLYPLAKEMIEAATQGAWSSETKAEMQGLAIATGYSLEDIYLANLFYELTPVHFDTKTMQDPNPPLVQKMCTSIVAQLQNNSVIFARNQDYGLPGLNNITFQVQFIRGGKPVYVGTTFAGYIGMPTGMRFSDNNPWSVSMDSRFVEEGLNYSDSIASAKAGGNSGGLFIRGALENCESFEEAMDWWQNKPTIAPGFFILGGTAPKQGCVFSRNRDGPDNSHNHEGVWCIEDRTPAPAPWFRLETNWDHWVPDWLTDGRRKAADTHMLSIGRENMGFEALYNVLSTPPVLANDTDYTTFAFPAQGYYRTIVRGGYIPLN